MAKVIQRDLNLRSLIKSICARPAMYVGFGENFRMVAAFIQGYAYASESFSDELNNFSYWIAIKLKLPRNVAWFCNIEEKYPNPGDALKLLHLLFEEFKSSDKKNSQLQ